MTIPKRTWSVQNARRRKLDAKYPREAEAEHLLRKARRAATPSRAHAKLHKTGRAA